MAASFLIEELTDSKTEIPGLVSLSVPPGLTCCRSAATELTVEDSEQDQD